MLCLCAIRNWRLVLKRSAPANRKTGDPLLLQQVLEAHGQAKIEDRVNLEIIEIVLKLGFFLGELRLK